MVRLEFFLAGYARHSEHPRVLADEESEENFQPRLQRSITYLSPVFNIYSTILHGSLV